MFNLTGHVAVITGADSDLGEQFACVLADHGAHVALLGRDLGRMEKICKEIGKKKKMAIAVPCDLKNAAQVVEAVGKVIEEYGRADILINNCGGNLSKSLLEMPEEGLNKAMATNINAVFNCVRLFVREMKRLGYGRIVNVASGVDVVRNDFPAIAHQFRGTLKSYTKALSQEMAKHGITVNAVFPGYIRTELTSEYLETEDSLRSIKKFCPLGRAGEKGELSAAVLYLASEESSYTTGACIRVDGGWLLW